MKKIIVCITAMFILSACGTNPPGGWTWGYVKSPQSGRCFEVASHALGADHGTAFAVEIPCSEMKR